MAQPSYAPSYIPVSVIGSQFIVPYLIELKIAINSDGDHLITDVNNRIMFKVKSFNTSNHRQRKLLDVDDKPIVTIREKMMSAHSGWNVFRGDSKANSDLIFRTKTPKMIQSKTNVHVLLANKTSSSYDACDFRITGSWPKRSCTIYKADSSTTIAQMHKIEPSAGDSSKLDKDKFMVTVYPNVDYAFVVALVTILEAMKISDDDTGEDVVEVVGTVAEAIDTALPFI